MGYEVPFGRVVVGDRPVFLMANVLVEVVAIDDV